MGQRYISLSLVLLGAVACGGERTAGNEDTSVTQQSIGASCAAADPDATFISTISYTSPHSYSNPGCFKGSVVRWNDVPDCSAASGGSGGGSGTSTRTATATCTSTATNTRQCVPSRGCGVSVSDVDTPPTTQTACEALWLAAYRFSEQGDGTFAFESSLSASGTWGPRGGCIMPKFAFPPETFVAGHDYKFAVTARARNASTAPTRRFSMRNSF